MLESDPLICGDNKKLKWNSKEENPHEIRDLTSFLEDSNDSMKTVAVLCFQGTLLLMCIRFMGDMVDN